MKRLGSLLLAAAMLAGCSGSGAGPTPQIVYRDATPAPTKVPTRVTPAPAEEGTGVVRFGVSFNTNTLAIVKPATSFKTSTKVIAWSADFVEAAGETSLTEIFARRSAGGVENLVYKITVDIADPDFTIVANKSDLALQAERKPGTYVMRYLRGATVLAEGTFTLVK